MDVMINDEIWNDCKQENAVGTTFIKKNMDTNNWANILSCILVSSGSK